MRFALIATSAAAALAVPFAITAAAPQMSSDQFVQSVSCAAYENATGADAATAKWQLNSEARRQAPETAAEARAAAARVAREAVSVHTEQDAAMLRQSVCGGAQLTVDADSRTAV